MNKEDYQRNFDKSMRTILDVIRGLKCTHCDKTISADEVMRNGKPFCGDSCVMAYNLKVAQDQIVKKTKKK